MKNLYDINKWLIIITLLLYFTFWGGIIAQVVLGISQIIMSIIIMVHYPKLSKFLKILFVFYVISTVSTILLYRKILHSINGGLEIMFLFIFVTMILAFFHLYITHKIKKL